MTVFSDLPAGAGLGSSAAYSVSLSAAFLVGSEKLPRPSASKVSTTVGVRGEILDLMKVADSSELCGMSWNQSHLDVINGWSLEAETLVHGTPSGIDNTISTNGESTLLFFFTHVFMNTHTTIVVTSDALPPTLSFIC